MSVAAAGKIYLALSAIAIAFQLALALGAPWGQLTMWGAYPNTLPAHMRIAAAGSVLLLLGFAAIVAARAGLALPAWRRASRWLIWIVVAYMLAGTVLNAVTPSPGERAIWLPVALVLLACAARVALGRAREG